MTNRLLISLHNDKKHHLLLTSMPLSLVRVKEANEYTIKYLNTPAPHSSATITKEDMDGFSIIFVLANVSVPIMTDVAVGRCVHICSQADEMIQIVPEEGVVITPADGCYLRRNGSVVALLYLGDNHWQAIGELP